MSRPTRSPRAPGVVSVLAATVIAALVAAACSGERAAPVPTRPTPPPTITTVPAPDGSVDGVDPVTTQTPPTESSTPVPTTTPGPTTTNAPPTAEQWARFDAELNDRLIGRGDYSASFALRRNGSLLHSAAYGVRVPTLPAPTATPSTDGAVAPSAVTVPPSPPPGAGEPAEVDHRFRVASISKVVTAAVVMQLVESGDIDLDEPVGGRLAEALDLADVDPVVANITTRQLLSHTSGFGTFRSTFFGGDASSCREAGRIGLTRGAERPPGSSYSYSNMNYCLLGLLVADVTGQPYEELAQRQLLTPLGLDGMRIAGTFDPNPEEVEHPSTPGRVYMEALEGAGAWVATATDIVTIADALEGSRPGWHPLSQDTMALMRVPSPTTAAPPAVRTSWYGLGQIVYADGSWGHTGTIENTHAQFLVRPDGVTWALLISGNYPGESDDLRRIVDDALAAAEITF